jgi:hypothetical protein
MPQQIIPFNEANILTDQPWLTENDRAQIAALDMTYNQELREKFGPDVSAMFSDNVGEKSHERMLSFHHFILTPDFRVVEEPNCLRWGIFLERGTHRVIEQTKICDGSDREFDYSMNSWASQQRRKRKRQEYPSFKIEETRVSSVFIGTCERELFETMIFGGWLNNICWRSSTLEDVRKAHRDAINLAHLLKRYIKKHGKRVRKDWVRMYRFWRLANKRGRPWAIKQSPVMQRVDRRLGLVPGEPSTPQGDFLLELAQIFIPRQYEGREDAV